MQIVFSGNMPAMKDHWMTDPAVSGGGAAMDNACHALDLFQFILGGITSSSVEHRHSWEGRGEDSFAISAKSDQGALGVFLGSYLCSVPENRWEICGTEAVLSFNYDGGGATLVKTSSDKQREEISVAAASTRFPSQMLSWLESIEGRQSDIATAEQALDIALVLSADKLLV
jgi:predicted dehydrogenase